MKQLRLAITGDLSLTGSFEKNIRNNTEIFSDEILSVLKSVDYCICNLEGPVTNRTINSDSCPKLNSPLNSISYLAKRNIKIFNLANNHIFDYGVDGFKDTINELKNNNCLYFGAWQNKENKNSILIDKELNLRLSSFTEKIKLKDASIKIGTLKYLSNLNNTKEARNIIFHHGGEEYTLFPSPTKRNLLKKIQKKYKPELIISHHSHTLQGSEKVRETNIFYSLGNFIFDIQAHHFYQFTNESAILILTINDKSCNYELVPIHINRVKGLIEKGSNDIIQKFNQLSDFSNYKNKWRKDAHRVLIERLPIPTELLLNKESLHKKNFFELLLDFQFYKKAFKVAFDNNNRSIYWNALLYKLFYKK